MVKENNVKSINQKEESEEKKKLRFEASQLFDKVKEYQDIMNDLDKVRKISEVQQVLIAAQLNIMVCYYEVLSSRLMNME